MTTPPGGDDLHAARQQFAERGYDGTTVRGVARRAGVDPALVHHHFDGKQQLFVEAMGHARRPGRDGGVRRRGDLAELGERILRTFLGVWEAPENRARMMGFVRSVTTNDAVAAMVRYVVRFEPIASVDVDDLVPVFAPTLQRYLTGDWTSGP